MVDPSGRSFSASLCVSVVCSSAPPPPLPLAPLAVSLLFDLCVGVLFRFVLLGPVDPRLRLVVSLLFIYCLLALCFQKSAAEVVDDTFRKMGARAVPPHLLSVFLYCWLGPRIFFWLCLYCLLFFVLQRSAAEVVYETFRKMGPRGLPSSFCCFFTVCFVVPKSSNFVFGTRGPRILLVVSLMFVGCPFFCSETCCRGSVRYFSTVASRIVLVVSLMFCYLFTVVSRWPPPPFRGLRLL